MVFGCQSIENTAKTSGLDRLYTEKYVNYGVFDRKNVKYCKKKNTMFFNIIYIYIYV